MSLTLMTTAPARMMLLYKALDNEIALADRLFEEGLLETPELAEDLERDKEAIAYQIDCQAVR